MFNPRQSDVQMEVNVRRRSPFAGRWCSMNEPAEPILSCSVLPHSPPPQHQKSPWNTSRQILKTSFKGGTNRIALATVISRKVEFTFIYMVRLDILSCITMCRNIRIADTIGILSFNLFHQLPFTSCGTTQIANNFALVILNRNNN